MVRRRRSRRWRIFRAGDRVAWFPGGDRLEDGLTGVVLRVLPDNMYSVQLDPPTEIRAWSPYLNNEDHETHASTVQKLLEGLQEDGMDLQAPLNVDVDALAVYAPRNLRTRPAPNTAWP